MLETFDKLKKSGAKGPAMANLSGWVDEALEKMPATEEANSNSKSSSANALSSLMGFGF